MWIVSGRMLNSRKCFLLPFLLIFDVETLAGDFPLVFQSKYVRVVRLPWLSRFVAIQRWSETTFKRGITINVALTEIFQFYCYANWEFWVASRIIFVWFRCENPLKTSNVSIPYPYTSSIPCLTMRFFSFGTFLKVQFSAFTFVLLQLSFNSFHSSFDHKCNFNIAVLK